MAANPFTCVDHPAYRRVGGLGRRQDVFRRTPDRTGRPFVRRPAARPARPAVVILLVLTLLACAGVGADRFAGRSTRPDNRFPLDALGAGEQTWSGKHLDIHYNAATQGDNLGIDGFVAFGSNIGKYPVINYFRIYLLFLDANGTVLETKLLWTSGGRSEVRFVRWTFEQQWRFPPGAAAIGFSYRGGVTESGGDSKKGQSQTGWEVYQLP